MTHVGMGDGAPAILSQECVTVVHDVVAAEARHPGGGRGVLVMAPAGSRRAGVAPHLAQEPDVLPDCKRQYDRNDG